MTNTSVLRIGFLDWTMFKKGRDSSAAEIALKVCLQYGWIAMTCMAVICQYLLLNSVCLIAGNCGRVSL